MSNTRDIRQLNQKKRLEAVVENLSSDAQQGLALTGLRNIRQKEIATRRARQKEHVVRVRRVTTLPGGQTVTVDRYLTNDIIRGTLERRLGDAYTAHRFPDKRRAEQANALMSPDRQGEVILESEMEIPANQLPQSPGVSLTLR